ncbi:MAG: hypothetical protein ABIZ80_02105 [Bryobacteraceae bacterium]
MKRFQFDLTRVLDWRRQQLELEQVKLEPMLGELSVRKSRIAQCEAERRELRRPVAFSGSAEAQDLAAAERYWLHLGGRSRNLAAELAACEQRILQQRERIARARQRLRLLEQLEQRRRDEWQTGVDREQEALAAELYLARRKDPSE